MDTTFSYIRGLTMTDFKILASLGILFLFSLAMILADLIYKNELKKCYRRGDHVGVGYWTGHRHMYRLATVVFIVVGVMLVWTS